MTKWKTDERGFSGCWGSRQCLWDVQGWRRLASMASSVGGDRGLGRVILGADTPKFQQYPNYPFHPPHRFPFRH
jgi:hypothetical protein